MKNYKQSRFQKIIRVSRGNHRWLAQNKGCYKTMAGTLDAIINKAKKDYKPPTRGVCSVKNGKV